MKKALILSNFIMLVGVALLLSYAVHMLLNLNLGLYYTSEINRQILESRRYERDFFYTRNPHYLKRIRLTFTQLEQSILLLQQLPTLKNNSVLQEIPTILREYKELFFKAVDEIEYIGITEDQGLHGQVSESIHRAEALIRASGDHYLMSLLLSARKFEKDFLIQKSEIILLDHSKELRKLFASLQSSILANHNTEDIYQYLMTYQTYFDLLVVSMKKLGLTPQKGIMGQINQTRDHMLPLITGLQQISREQQERQVHYINLLILLSSILILFNVYLFFRLQKSNEHLQQDIHRREESEQKLQDSEKRIRAMFNSANIGIISSNEKGQFIEFNDTLCHMLGYTREEMKKLTYVDIVHRDNQGTSGDIIQQIQRCKEGSHIFENRYQRKNGSYFWGELSLTPIHGQNDTSKTLVMVVIDITDRKRVEEVRLQLQIQAQMAHAGRLAALGELASGMAHEINQPLTVIRLIADTLKQHFIQQALGKLETENIEKIIHQVDRASSIIKNVRTFSRPKNIKIHPIDLAIPLDLALGFFREQFRSNQIQLLVEMDEQLPLVSVDPQKFEQIVVNLLSNARYAVEKKKEYCSQDYKKQISIRLYYADKERNLVFEVSDNGIGMSAEVQARCMEPFYTTKDVGEGTGLGLSIVHSILSEFKMDIAINSTLDQGCVFKIYIPMT